MGYTSDEKFARGYSLKAFAPVTTPGKPPIKKAMAMVS
jgi:hypothetical protein